MKKTGKLFLFAVLIFLTPSLSFAENSWELKNDKSGIKIYTRRVEGSPILEFKAETVFDVPIEKVLALYEQPERMPEWYHNCIESKLLEEISPDEKVLYFALSMPWPVSDRDSIYKRVRSHDPKTGAVSFYISALPNRLPPHSGRVRVPSIKTLWRFTPVDEGRSTAVYYQQHSDAGGSIPAGLVNSLATTIPYHSLKNFRKLL